MLTAVQDEGAVFPVGTFVAAEWGDYFVEFNDDGTCRWANHRYGESWDCTYEVDGDLYTETTNNSGEKGYVVAGPVPPPPVTFRWAYAGEFLGFELVGEDPNSWRRAFYEDQVYRFVPEPCEVVLAGYDIAAGTELLRAHTELRVVPGAEAPADALSDRDLATGRIAAVPITEGQAITPGLLTSPE
jgi:hypothetical protein